MQYTACLLFALYLKEKALTTVMKMAEKQKQKVCSWVAWFDKLSYIQREDPKK